MMTGTPIESNVWMAYLLTVFLVVTGFAVYDILYRRVPDRALVFFIPLAALAPLIQVYFILEYDRMPIFIWPVVTEALMGALLGFCIPLAAAMATGGSGDVLSGVIVSLLGQGVMPLEAAACAAWLHGSAGDLAAAEIGEYGMTPEDLLTRIPRLLR